MEVLRSEYRLQEAYTGSRSSAMYSKDGATRREEAVRPCDNRRWRRHRVHHWGVYVCANEAEVMKRVHVRCDDNVFGCQNWKMLGELDHRRVERISPDIAISSSTSRCKFSTELIIFHGTCHFPCSSGPTDCSMTGCGDMFLTVIRCDNVLQMICCSRLVQFRRQVCMRVDKIQLT